MKVKLLILAVITAIFTSCHTSVPDNWGVPVVLLQPFEGELYSISAFVADLNTGEVLFEKQADERLNPASTIKIMTALVVLDTFLNADGHYDMSILTDTLQVPPVVFERFDTHDPNTIGGSMAGYEIGQDNLSYRDALYGLMLPSGNDAANVLAYNTGYMISGDEIGAIDLFIGMMNDTAKRIGAVNTNFTNAHGLLEVDNYSTTRDLALITRYAYNKHILFRELSIARDYIMPANDAYPEAYRVGNSNMLVRKPSFGEKSLYYRDFVTGVKTGALDEVFYLENGSWVEYDGITNLVSVAEKDGRSYIIVTLEAPYKYGDASVMTDADGYRMSRLHYTYADHLELYDWLFTHTL
jgi:D-alanyl-D-alanine carboxypeptidase (penicillin-binding protein 5/6)